MLARVLIIVIVNTAFLAAVLWWIPIEGILSARGYTPAQIAALQAAAREDQAAAASVDTRSPSAGANSNGAEKQAASADSDARKLVATATVNVRTGPGTNHSAVGQVTTGDVVIVLEDPGGEWVRIKLGELRGWVYLPLFEPKGK